MRWIGTRTQPVSERKSIEEIRLQGGKNLGRSLRREEAELERTLSPAQLDELQTVNALIQQCLRACRRGQTVKGRANPAFKNLESLYRVRKAIVRRRDNRAEEPGQDPLAELNAKLSKAN